MRIPFSIYLMPVFWLSVAALPLELWHWPQLVFVGAILHLLLYPASNGYNSLIDKDEDPVGGIEKPPPVSVELNILVIFFDVLALTSSFLVNVFFGFCVAIYWLVSKAYSSPQIRLKKLPYVSWLVVAIFQGGWTVLMVWCGLTNTETVIDVEGMWIWPLIATLFLAGSYPVTQVYQHESDGKRGDLTLSRILGVKGTFVLAFCFILAGSGILVWTFIQNRLMEALFILLACTTPSFIYFFLWAKRVFQDTLSADFESTMRFNKISSLGLSFGFIGWLCIKIFGISLHL
jgi:1,4-dihydroxy-2-naphthoate octaprenyltransferase